MSAAPNSSCSNCGERLPFESLFKCYFCDSRRLQSTNSTKVFCDGCVTSHLRKGHQILDYKDREASVCSKHAQLQTEYCQTCDVIFCIKCLANHSGHKFGKVKEKATELRKDVFDRLREWELAETKTKTKSDSVSEITESFRSKTYLFMDYVKSKFDETRDRCLAQISENLEQSEQYDLKGKRVLAKVGDAQIMLRNSLQITDAKLLTHYPLIVETLDRIELENTKLLKWHLYKGRIDSYDSLNKSLNNLQFKVVNMVCVPQNMGIEYHKRLPNTAYTFRYTEDYPGAKKFAENDGHFFKPHSGPLTIIRGVISQGRAYLQDRKEMKERLIN